MTITEILNQKLVEVFTSLGLQEFSPQINFATKPEFGDFQVNGVMNAAKKQKSNPRVLAAELNAKINAPQIIAKSEIAGAGFINIELAPKFLASFVQNLLTQKLTFNDLPLENKIMVEYSSPNLAKEMHVGHLRSSIIGDALARVFEFVGFEVIRANHVGDWGTQFGMLIAYMSENITEKGEQGESTQTKTLLNDLENFYRLAKTKFDSDPDFAERARSFVVRLQSGDKEVYKLWQEFVETSINHCLETYKLLGVGLERAHTFGESFYNNDLTNVVSELKAQGLLVEDAGAQVVFLPKADGDLTDNQTMIIQKKDGGFLYSTTDIAAVRYRHQKLNLARVLYVVDSRQALHFQQLFRLCKIAKFAPPSMQLEHIAFGMVLGDDGKPFKTRDGGTVKLINLLNEACERAFKIVREKNPERDDKWCHSVAKVVGIGAVKYADLSKNRVSDYIFNWEQMLSFEGNTAPYLQYAYTRIQSILRKNVALNKNNNNLIVLNRGEKVEWQLALALAQFEDVIKNVCASCQPHLLCTYLYHVATLFSRFYEACPILKAEENLRTSRLQISRLTAQTLKQGLELLGINVLEEM